MRLSAYIFSLAVCGTSVILNGIANGVAATPSNFPKLPTHADSSLIQDDSVRQGHNRWYNKLTNLANSKVLPSPAFGRSPETGILIGGGVFYATQLNQDPLARKSQISVAGAYTQRKQWILTQSGLLSIGNDRHILQWNLGWRNFFDRYYGLETEVSPKYFIPYRFETLNLHATLLTRIAHSSHFMGPVLRFNSMYHTAWEEDPTTRQWQRPPGYEGHATVGLGARWVHDTRLQLINPRQGHWYEFAYRMHPRWSNLNPAYNQWNLDLRRYQPLRNRANPKGPLDDVVWAHRIFLHSAGQGVSFREMPALGGDNLLRGYFRGYTRGHRAWVIENELRGMWGKRLGWNLYWGAGQSGNTWESVVERLPRQSLGGGLRILPNPSAGTLLRIDYARTIDGQVGVYFEVNEAF